DNNDRELKEAARQQRLRELQEKRLAWAGEEQSSVFGRSSSESDVEMLTKEGLLDFFQKRSQSQNSPLGRSMSARRHRHTVTSTADRELQEYLELFGGTGNPANYSRFHSLPRSGRPLRRNAMSWILAQDDSRELTSPNAEMEPISPLARFSSTGLNNSEDLYNDNNNYSSASESGVLPRSFCVFQKPAHIPNPAITGHMNVSVEKYTLVQGPQAFDLQSPNNNSNRKHLVSLDDVVVTELEKETEFHPKNQDSLKFDELLEKRVDPKAGWEGKVDFPTQTEAFSEREKEDEDYSTVSSTTCDTPLPLDASLSNKKPMFYIIDCSETDCSVALDYSEADSTSLPKEGLQFGADCSKGLERQQGPNSSRNDQSISTSELSAPTSVDTASVAASATTEDWDTESCDTAEGKQAVEKDQRPGRKPVNSKSNKVSKGSGGRGVRTLTSSESQGIRKVVPISRVSRTNSSKRTDRPSVQDSGETHRHLRDQSTPARGRAEKTMRPPRHSSVPPDESKIQKGGGLTGGVSRWARDSIPRKASLHKPSAKPLRNIPKPVHEEKMCRSTMRALAQAQAQTPRVQGGPSSENSSSQTQSANNSSDLPSFARNTVASSSRTKRELGPPSVPTTPSRSPSLQGRQTSTKQSRASPTVHTNEEQPQGTHLRRVQSVKAASRSAYRSGTPPPTSTRGDIRKTSSFSEKSVQLRDSLMSGKPTKPSWK
ncbi:hypothetical protein AMECASPLE_035971, partial [Ameca splendens]